MGNVAIKPYEVSKNLYGLFIDKRDSSSYLRFADLDDCNCLESGNKIKINFCPFCGEKLN